MVFGTNRGWVTGPRASDRLRLLGIRIGLGLCPLDHGLHGNGGLAGGGVHVEVLEEDLRSAALRHLEEEDAKLAAFCAAIDEGDASPDVVGFDEEDFIQEMKAGWRAKNG